MARNRKRAKQDKRQGREPQHASTQAPLSADQGPTTTPPDPVADASGVAEEAKLSIEIGALDIPSPLRDDLAATDESKGRVFDDEIPSHDPTLVAGERPVRGPRRFAHFLRACWSELQRVQWPDRKQVAQATGVVLGFVIIAGGYLGLLDALFSRLVSSIL
ncbi:MAG: preprotein translocase subunit SecE [Solirubrobacterales bacterium]|nr:preprotein translocase subunit SecE [Solirubrobacterales bacterium]